MNNWENVVLVPEFDEQGVACYRLDGGNYLNEYYIVSEAESRKLLNTPEIVGYEVYNCLISATSQMLYYLKEQKKVTTANILSILRGALNYPLEESCYREHIRVHDISFLSSERVFENEEIAGLEIKYSKLTMVPDSTLMIGDIIASGTELHAKASRQLIENVFFPKSPLHDGALVIRDGRLYAAGCILPLTKKSVSSALGTRHRAGIGLTEQSDAVVVIVSEETGSISVAMGGVLNHDVSDGDLRDILKTEFLPSGSSSDDKIISRLVRRVKK